MKNILTAVISVMSLIMCVSVYSQAPRGAAAQEPVYDITQIGDNLYRFQKNFHYTVFLVTPEGIILADPISDPDDGPALWLKDQLAKRFKVPVKYVIYSHHHLDHAAGGEIFADTAEYIGHENMSKYFDTPRADQPIEPFFASIDKNGDNRLTKEEAAGPLASRFDGWDIDKDGFLNSVELAAGIVSRVHKPDKVYSDRMTIELGGQNVELIHPGNNHSDDMTVILFPEQRVVYGVDFLGVFSGMPGGVAFSGAPMMDWIKAYRAVEALDFDIIAPGHGPMGRKADVTLTRMAWEDLYDAVSTGIKQGKTVEELQRTVKLDNYKHYPEHDKRLKNSIADAYRSLMKNK